jgi:hypothetical protein
MKSFVAALLALSCACAWAQKTQVVDLPTRSGVTERFVAIAPDAPKAAVILLAGGPGRVKILGNGTIRNEGNFLVRTRAMFVQQGFAAVVLDAPSDRPGGMPVGFRGTPEHVADLAAAIAWAREQWHKPVWLVGTSRGTQSAAHAAVALANDPHEPDGIVLTSTILARSPRDPGVPVTEEPLDTLKIPVLVVHHEEDPCPICNPALLNQLKLPASNSKVIMEKGGASTGEACQSFSHHGYNGIEGAVVADISAFITAH